MTIHITSYSFETPSKTIPYEGIILFLQRQSIPFILRDNPESVFFLQNDTNVRIECYQVQHAPHAYAFVKVDASFKIKKSLWFDNFYYELVKEVNGVQANIHPHPRSML